MKVFDELSWYNVMESAWSGAKDTADTIEENNKGEEFCQLIEECYPEGIDRTQLNDIMWFDSEWIFDQLGIEENSED